MSDLSDRLRTIAPYLLRVDRAAVLEAAAELDRLESIVGKAAAYTDDAWAAELVAADRAAGPLFPPPVIRGLLRELSQAGDALAMAQGYWERHLAATGGR